MKNIRLIFFLLAAGLSLSMSGCDEELFNTLDKTSYAGISATKAEIILDYKRVESNEVSKIYVFLYHVAVGGKVSIIDSMGSAGLKINGTGMVFGTTDGYECFYPENPDFRLVPDSVYHITITDNTGIYDSYAIIPPAFGDIELADTLDLSEAITLGWTNPYPSFKIHAYIEVYNPTDVDENIVVVDENLSQQNRVKVPTSLSPFIDGWYGKIILSREQQGLSSQMLYEKSTIVARSSFLKQFVIKKD